MRPHGDADLIVSGLRNLLALKLSVSDGSAAVPQMPPSAQLRERVAGWLPPGSNTWYCCRSTRTSTSSIFGTLRVGATFEFGVRQ